MSCWHLKNKLEESKAHFAPALGWVIDAPRPSNLEAARKNFKGPAAPRVLPAVPCSILVASLPTWGSHSHFTDEEGEPWRDHSLIWGQQCKLKLPSFCSSITHSGVNGWHRGPTHTIPFCAGEAHPGICLAGCTPRSSTESSWSGWGRGAHMTSFVAGMLSCVDFCAVLLSKLGEKPKISMFKRNAWHSGPGCLGEMG